MSTVAEILSALDRTMPFERAAGWDVTGLQLGDPSRPARTVAVCHEVTEAVVAVAEKHRPDLLVTYHPLLFSPTTRVTAGRSPVGRAFRLIEAGVSLAVVHTAFDVAPGGCADALADALSLESVTGFGHVTPEGKLKVVTFVPVADAEAVSAAMTGAGAGRIGDYHGCIFRTPGIGSFTPGEGASPVVGAPGEAEEVEEARLETIVPTRALDRVLAALVEAHPYEEPPYDVYEVRSNAAFSGRIGSLVPPTGLGDLAATVGEVLAAPSMRVSGDDREVRRVAVLPGSGSSMIREAAGAGAEVFVTGDVSHHRVVEALDLGLAIIDAGHAPTERPGVRRLAEVVGGLADVLDLTSLDPTPWQ